MTARGSRIKGASKGSIKGMVNFRISLLDPSKLANVNISALLCMYEALWEILTTMESNSHFGKRLRARDITILGCRSLPMLPNMYFLINEIFRTRPPGHLRG